MKKMLVMLVALVLVLSVSALADGPFNVRLGYDMGGTIEADSDNFADTDVDSGVFISGEYLFPYTGNIDLGTGLTHQFSRDMNSGESFAFTPFYGFAKYNMDNAFLIGKFGYNIFNMQDLADDDSTSGGLYYGIGAGVNFAEDFNAELLYSVNNGILSEEGAEDLDLTYSKISLSLGYSF